MMPARSLVFKTATEPAEFEQIHRLNYRTFVEEIPQHEPDNSGRLIDKFHDENTYFICRDVDRVVGMICLRGSRPFSLDRKLPDLDGYLPRGRSLCEIRLLAVEKDYRRGRVLSGLVTQVVDYRNQKGFDMALISATTRERKLYHHLGFVAFGPLVGVANALFQPMYLTLEAFQARFGDFPSRNTERKRQADVLKGALNPEELPEFKP